LPHFEPLRGSREAKKHSDKVRGQFQDPGRPKFYVIRM
jgi:hypothetical protein